jgi:peptide/nickel transport system permease protein
MRGSTRGSAVVRAETPVAPHPATGVRRARRDWTLRLALAWIGMMTFAAVAGPWLPLPDPNHMDMLDPKAAWSTAHWFGTDAFGRDVLSRLVAGARVSLAVGVLAPLVGLACGTALGMAAGYFRGRLDTVVTGGIDVLLAFPPLVLTLATVAYLGQSATKLTLILGFIFIPAFTRVARAATLTWAQREFVHAAKALGATHLRILLRELLPNVAMPLIAFFLVAVAVTVVAEGAVSFLGLGVPPPQASWGGMIAEGRESLDSAPALAFLPAIVMFVTVLAFNLVGDALRARTDARRSAP